MISRLPIVITQIVALHLNLNPRLDCGANWSRVIGLDVKDLDQPAVGVAANHQLGMQDQSWIAAFNLKRARE